MEFKYDAVKAYNKTIDILDPGNVNLEATTHLGTKYYLIVKSYLGIMVILEYGPLDPFEVKEILSADINKTECILTKQDFDSKKLNKTISDFISSRERGKIKIVDVFEITEEEALSKGINLFNYIRDFDKE